MSSGQSLLIFMPQSYEPTATNYALFNTRNGHPVLEFTTSTGLRARWSGVMPQNYAGTGVKVLIDWAMATATATTGNVAWLMSWERMATQDIDSDGFGATSTATHVETPSVCGVLAESSTTVTATTDLDEVAAGDSFRFQLTRHVATDTATGKVQVVSVELREA